MKKGTIIGLAVVAVSAVVFAAAFINLVGSAAGTYRMNETGTFGNVSFTVTEVSDTQNVGLSSTSANFIVIYVTTTNNSNGELTATSSNFKLYRGSAVYELSSSGIWLTNGFTGYKKIGSGLTVNMVLVYETPTKHTVDNYELKVKSSNKTATFLLY